MTDEDAKLVRKLHMMAQAVYLAAASDVAKDIANGIHEAADAITRLSGQTASPVAWSVWQASASEDRLDARRYRFLRDVSTATWRSFQEQWREPARECDAIIDAQLAKVKQEDV